MSIEYIDYTTGNTLYGKPRPLNTSPWSGDTINLFENGTTGEYSGVFTTNNRYSIFIQSGGTPGSGDINLGALDLRSTNVSGEVTLADGSITASTYDQSTAYPIQFADTGGSKIFRNDDNLNLSGIVVSGVELTVDYTIQIPAVNLPQVTTRNIQIFRSTEWGFEVSGIGASADEFFFTVKVNNNISDEESQLQVNTSGVTYLSGTYIGQPSGQLTYSSGNGGTLNVSLEPEITSLLTPNRYIWDMKGIDGTDKTTIRSYGNIDIKEVVTRRIG